MESLTVILEPAEEGAFTSYIAEIPGEISLGKDEDDAINTVRNALDELFA